MYEKSRELAGISIQDWLSNEVFSFGWFLLIGVIIAAYIVWLLLLDRKRAARLLLIGALAAVAYSLNSMVLGDILGLVEYRIRLFPLYAPVFMSSITLSPIIIMLVEQYLSSWKGYALWSAIGFAFLSLGIFTLFQYTGIIAFHGWNVFYHFLVLYGISLMVRLAFLWIRDTQNRCLKKHEAK